MGTLEGSLLHEAAEDEDASETVLCFAVHPNGQEIVVAMQSSLLRHYNMGTRDLVRSFRGHQMPVLAMDYDKTGTLVATGSADKTVRVWDVPRGYCTHNFRDHNDIVQLVQFHPDPTQCILFSASDDSTLRMYNLKTNSCTAVFRQHMSLPTAIAFSMNNDGNFNFMVSVGRDQVLVF